MSATDSLHQRGARYVPEIAGNIRLALLHRYVLARQLARNRIVLDIACGDGEGADLLAPVATSVIGVDPAPDRVAAASRRYRRANLTFRGGSCTAIPIMDASVDLVVSFDTIEYEAQQVRMLEEMRRVLAPGGLLILSTPDRDECAAAGHRNPLHVALFSRDELGQSLRAYFPHVSIVGQRMRAGSFVGPLDDRTDVRFQSAHHDDHDGEAVVGLDAPLDLIAVASDEPLPPIPIGVMDGGDFVFVDHPAPAVVPPRDETIDGLTRRVADLARLHARERRRLIDIRDVVANLHAAVDHHRAEAQAAWERVRIHEVRSAALEREQLAALDEERAAYQRHLSRVEQDAADARVRGEGLAAAIQRLEGERASERAAVAAERDRWRAREAELLDALNQMTATADRMAAIAAAQEQTIGHRDQTIRVMERSRSWRVTGPLRDLRRLMSRMATR
jgi:O-antigen biosynthesis protein